MAHYGMETNTCACNPENGRVDFVHGWHVPCMRSSLPLNFEAVMEYSAKPCWVVWTFRAMPTYPLIYLNLSRCFNAVVKCTIVHLCTVIICSTFERKQIYFSRKRLCRKFSFILFKICLDGGIFYKVFLYAFSFFWCRLT